MMKSLFFFFGYKTLLLCNTLKCISIGSFRGNVHTETHYVYTEMFCDVFSDSGCNWWVGAVYKFFPTRSLWLYESLTSQGDTACHIDKKFILEVVETANSNCGILGNG